MEPATLAALVVLVALLIAAVPVRRGSGGRTTNAAGRYDNELHRQRAAAAAQMESHDIDDMLDAIDARRRASGRRAIGEELADEALRSTWEKP